MASSGDDVKPTFCQKVGTGCSSFGNFLYNSETKTVMGRSGQSWAKIGVFYLVFYGFLAGFFSAMLAVFMTTVELPENNGKPKLTQYIENKPGLTRLDRTFRLGGYDSSQNSSSYANNLIAIFKEIKENKDSIYDGPCPATGPNNGSKPCYLDFSSYGACAPADPLDESMFGLKDKKPCVFIKINKVYGWIPKGNDYLELSCSGEGFAGTFPSQGFRLAGFPFKGVKGHRLPYVAVQVDATKKVSVKCFLKGEGISVSDSYNKARSFGNILIDGISTK